MIKFLLIAFLFTGVPAMAETKEPPFTSIKKEDAFEIREYAPMLIAEVVVEGERKEAINNGFEILAAYIFGKNAPKEKIAMTAPVMQEPKKGEAIEMTAPVTQQPDGNGAWKVHFVMPEGYTLGTLPKPVDPRIKILSVPSYRAAVIRFSGFGGTETMAEKTVLLEGWMAKNALKPSGPSVYAYYNPPWTLPFLRRNEVMIRLVP